jgi:predicted dehydrogenase
VVAAIASRGIEHAREAAQALNISRAYGSYEELLADPEIDAIYNPLPNHMHAEWSIKAAEAGKATLCEKPLASDAAEAQSMVDAFRARGILLAEAFMYRFHPQTVKVQELVQAGAVGRMLMMRAAFTFYMSPERRATDIRTQKEMAGGSLMDVGCYCITMRLMAQKEPERVTGSALWGPGGVDEALLGRSNFHPACLDTSTADPQCLRKRV